MSKKGILIPIVNGRGEIEMTCIAATLNHFGAEVVMVSVMQMDDHQCVMHCGMNYWWRLLRSGDEGSESYSDKVTDYSRMEDSA